MSRTHILFIILFLLLFISFVLLRALHLGKTTVQNFFIKDDIDRSRPFVDYAYDHPPQDHISVDRCISRCLHKHLPIVQQFT